MIIIIISWDFYSLGHKIIIIIIYYLFTQAQGIPFMRQEADSRDGVTQNKMSDL